MTKTINPDVAAFKDDFFKGLSFRECVFGGSALLTGVGGILLLHFYFGVGINTAITLCMPVIGIIGLCGFYHKKRHDIGSACEKEYKAHISKALCL